ncbi:hypothetical protein [Nocardia sp. NBC_01009]|uniref:hypothetical protein n=1 Tax=Nocardia sp. NBC_01009 TaxID=2975996 RepID=UPI0038682C80|nr:hypothetical protein OHA42_21855 [Nocardia sp. NBC_01009]
MVLGTSRWALTGWNATAELPNPGHVTAASATVGEEDLPPRFTYSRGPLRIRYLELIMKS